MLNISKEDYLIIGLIIKLIANNPGITRPKLLAKIQENGIRKITLRKLSDYLALIKSEFKLLPEKGKIKTGYFLNDIVTIEKKHLSVISQACNSLLEQFGYEPDEYIDLLALINDYQKLYNKNDKNISLLLKSNIISDSNNQLKELVNSIDRAIKNKNIIVIDYKNPRKASEQTTKYKLCPLFKKFYVRAWYVICKNVETKMFMPIRIDRIKKINITQNVNSRNKADIEKAQDLLSNSWGLSFNNPLDNKINTNKSGLMKYVVIFDKDVAPYISEGNRHKNAKIFKLPDGKIKFTIDILNGYEFIHWVRSFGSKAWFIEPENLVKEDMKDLQQKLDNYKTHYV